MVLLVEPQLREASVERNRTFVGLDVHAWSVTGHALDAVTGQVWQRKLTPWPCRKRAKPYPVGPAS